MGEFPSGQRGQTVNLLSVTSVVRIHLPPPGKPLHRQVWRFFLFVWWIRRGAGVNDAPAAHQSRGTARPQTGESTFPHQERVDACIGSFFLFSPGKQKIEQAHCVPTRYRLYLYLFLSFCASSPRGSGAPFSFPRKKIAPPRVARPARARTDQHCSARSKSI